MINGCAKEWIHLGSTNDIERNSDVSIADVSGSVHLLEILFGPDRDPVNEKSRRHKPSDMIWE